MDLVGICLFAADCHMQRKLNHVWNNPHKSCVYQVEFRISGQSKHATHASQALSLLISGSQATRPTLKSTESETSSYLVQ